MAKTTIVLQILLVILLNSISQVAAYYCRGLCDWDQYCCGDMQCCDEFLIWRVWYFWFLIILFVLILASCGAFCRYRRRTMIVPSYQPIAATHVATYQTNVPVPTTTPPAYTPAAPPPAYQPKYQPPQPYPPQPYPTQPAQPYKGY